MHYSKPQLPDPDLSQKQARGLGLGGAIVTVVIVIGAIATAAIASSYCGDINLKFGSDGIELIIKGCGQESERVTQDFS